MQTRNLFLAVNMINFTGSTNRRVVNLGDRRRGSEGTFLQQSHRDHQKREEQRRRERAAATICSYVSRHLDLRRFGERVASEWVKADVVKNWKRWCSEFAFLARFASPVAVDTALKTLEQTLADIDENLDTYSVSVLIRGLRATIDRRIDTNASLRCLLTLFLLYQIPIRYPRALLGLSQQITASLNVENYRDSIKLSFYLQCIEAETHFPSFMASIPTEYLFGDSSIAEITRKALLSEMVQSLIMQLDSLGKCRLLANYIKIVDPSFTVDDCAQIAAILKQIPFSIRTSNDRDAGDDNGDEYFAQDLLLQALLLLEKTPHISKAVDQFSRHNFSSNEHSLLPQLIRVFPDMRLKFCMICMLLPHVLKSFFNQISNYKEYSAIKEKGIEYAQIYHEEFQRGSSNDQFVSLLFSYSHLLSYWLTVTNDHESLNETSFPVTEAVDFTSFLKNLTLLLILRASSLAWQSAQLVQQKTIAIALLNQLYMKNLRVPFLPGGFWIASTLKLSKMNMIHLLQAEQKRLDTEEAEESSEDEGTTAHSSGRPKRRKLVHSEMVPAVEILKRLPFFVDFTDRVEVFRGLILAEKELEMSMSYYWDQRGIEADIRRDHVFEDAFEAYHKKGLQFKSKLSVTFYNEYGAEAGIDGGGITKELLTGVVSEVFHPGNEMDLFKVTDNYDLYPNPEITLKLIKNIDREQQLHKLEWMRFMGMIIGRCLYDGVLIDFKFAYFFLAKWRIAQTGAKSSIDDLAFLDTNLFRNLIKLMDMSAEEVAALDLNFIIDEIIDGKVVRFPLGAADEAENAVTPANRLKYIHLMANYKLNQNIQLQTRAFLNGLFEIIHPNWLNMFDPYELQMLISGTTDINLADWKKHVHYGGGYWETDATIQNFWEVVEEMNAADQHALVKFVTSVSRAPLLGFAALVPNFGISRVNDDTRLPTASTCANLLKLPVYKTKTELREKLLYSIHANSGFDLS